MSPSKNKVLTYAVALWAACAAVACGAATDDTGGESNWVRCTDDRDCSSDEVCDENRCKPEADAGSMRPIVEQEDASVTSSNGGEGGAVPPPATASSAAAGAANDEPGSSGAGTGGATAEPSSVGGAGGTSMPDIEPPHCAFPSPDRRSAPSGVVSDALPFSTDTCVRALSTPVALELPDDQGQQTLEFAYDVNQDGVEDPFYRDRNAGSEQPLNLWVSEIRDGELRFVHEPCALPTVATDSKRLHVGDLDADGTPDLIVEGKNWVIALRNERAGFTTALEHRFAPSEPDGWASLVDVAIANVAGDDAPDLVIGFDRTASSVGSLIEIGVIVFEGQTDSMELALSHSWVTPIDFSAERQERVFWGNFAIIDEQMDKAQLWLQVFEEGTWRIQESLTSGTALNPSMGTVYEIWGNHGVGGRPLIGVLGNTADLGDRLGLFEVSGESATLEAGGLEPVFMAYENRELGGGMALRQQFMLDVDGNTTTDFVEFNRTADNNAQQLAVHLGDLLVHFEPPVVLDLPTVRARYGHPFLSDGERALGLIAYDAQGPVSVDGVGTAPMVQRFICD